MVSVLPETGSANAIFSWLFYGMIATASFALTNALVGREIEAGIRKKA